MPTAWVSRYLARVGWAYVVYHVFMIAVLVALAIYDLGVKYVKSLGWAEVLTFVMLPPFIPGLLVCGGMHDRCDTLSGRGMQIVLFLGGVAWYLVGWWVLASLVVSRIRQRL
jgi:hypothetical protein